MTYYMFDTSGLVKFYHDEIGSDKVEQIVLDSNNYIMISDLSIVEFISSIAKKMRVGEIAAPSFRKARHRFFADVSSGRFSVVALTQKHGRGALKLLVKYGTKHGLRTLDALQLAIAIALKKNGRLHHFVCADKGLDSIAKLEKVRFLNPVIGG